MVARKLRVVEPHPLPISSLVSAVVEAPSWSKLGRARHKATAHRHQILFAASATSHSDWDSVMGGQYFTLTGDVDPTTLMPSLGMPSWAMPGVWALHAPLLHALEGTSDQLSNLRRGMANGEARSE